MPDAFDPTDATIHLLDLLEAGDRGIVDLLDEDVTWVAPMTATGDPDDIEPVQGKAAVLAHLASLTDMIGSAHFIDRRVTAAADGTTAFVQTQGDFATRSGRPYRNVYMFRFDWRDGRLAAWEEYANPITILRAFPELAPSST